MTTQNRRVTRVSENVTIDSCCSTSVRIQWAYNAKIACVFERTKRAVLRRYSNQNYTKLVQGCTGLSGSFLSRTGNSAVNTIVVYLGNRNLKCEFASGKQSYWRGAFI